MVAAASFEEIARRLAALDVMAAGAPGPTVTETLSDRGRRSTAETRTANDRAGVCDRMPEVEAALQGGTISAGHVDAIANATRHLDDTTRSAFEECAADLLAAAGRESVAEFERDVRDLVRFLSSDDGTERLERQRRDRAVTTWIDRTTGMHHLHATLDPEHGQKLATALQAQLATICQRPGNRDEPMQRLRADALVELVTRRGDGDAANRNLPEVVVLVDWRTLTTGVHARTVFETEAGVALPVTTVRRLCCEATVLPVVLGADGAVLDCGRTERVANRAQRRALAVRPDRLRQPGTGVHGTPSPRARRRVDPHHDTRPRHRTVPTRRLPVVPRPHLRPSAPHEPVPSTRAQLDTARRRQHRTAAGRDRPPGAVA